MDQIYDFERFAPPFLAERSLRRELERRKQRRAVVLLAIAGALLQALLVISGLLCLEALPALALGCICFSIISTAGSGIIAIVYTQKGAKNYDCSC